MKILTLAARFKKKKKKKKKRKKEEDYSQSKHFFDKEKRNQRYQP